MILGLDASSTNVGYGIIGPDGMLIGSGVKKLNNKKELTDGRLVEIYELVTVCVTGVKKIVLEDVPNCRKMLRTFKVLSIVQGAVLLSANLMGYTVSLQYPQTTRKNLGISHIAKKEEFHTQLRIKYPWLENIKNPDEMDGIALALSEYEMTKK